MDRYARKNGSTTAVAGDHAHPANGESIQYLSPKYASAGKLKCEYAVRGRILNEAVALEKELQKDPSSYNFDSVIYASIGNPQALGQKPITYCRQLVAAVVDPSLTGPSSPYPEDVKEKAKKILSDMPGNSAGSYTHTKGIGVIREQIAKMIQVRDGYHSDPENIFLITGATQGISLFLELLISHPNVGIMIPCPQYPVYSALITSHGGNIVYYKLNVSGGWIVDESELERAINSTSTEVRALCIINPGNPTGGLLPEECLKSAVKFASRHNLVILADEVYQLNIMSSKQFVSIKKVLLDLGPEYSNVQLISFNSASKGLLGECGMRGGYLECTNIGEDEMNLLLKLFSMRLCSPTIGQVMMSVIADPPVKGDPSYELYNEEISMVRKTNADNAKYFAQAFEDYPYVKLPTPLASLYLYPSFILPEKFIKEAKSKGMPPDEYLCYLLLIKKGICSTPGSGFSQPEETYNIRITITPKGIERIVTSIRTLMDWIYKEYT